jgi:hypothetical protein
MIIKYKLRLSGGLRVGVSLSIAFKMRTVATLNIQPNFCVLHYYMIAHSEICILVSVFVRILEA